MNHVSRILEIDDLHNLQISPRKRPAAYQPPALALIPRIEPCGATHDVLALPQALRHMCSLFQPFHRKSGMLSMYT